MAIEVRGGRDINVLRLGGAAENLLLHCTLARSEALVPLAQTLPGGSVLMDLLGHGKSADWDGQGDYQSANAAAALGLCDGPTHVIGHSFGATVALRLALDHPDRVKRLTLIEPVYFALATDAAAQADHIARFTPIYAAYTAGDLQEAARLFHSDWGGGSWDAMPPHTQAGFARRMPLIMAGTPSIQDDIHDAAGRLSQLQMPVCLIRGELSVPIVPAIHAGICAAVPQARDHVVPKAGHMVPLTHVAQVAQIIASEA
ncbi:alpha/beta fold hydrolase [Loktanella sp. R86503]|uniref:alpha/beta fold hydrolase n=1 Tax=Loktanella sp. R86503 TaxID=3093847 RepID=UPI0036DEB8BC